MISTNKELFKVIRKESKDYSEDITEGFPYFCLKIFWDDLSEDDIKEALIDLKTNDESIDAFFIDGENKELHFLQVKSCKSEKQIKALKKDWLAYFNDVIKKLNDDQYIDNHKNEKIKEIAKDFKIYSKQGYKPRLHFFHLGRADKTILDYYDDIIYYDLEDILNQYNEYDSKRDRTEPPEIDLQLEFPGTEPNINQKHKTFVGVITGDELIRLRELYRYKLFDKNLRFSLGKNKVNKGIIETTKQEASNFYFYNNGITITSKGFKYKSTNNTLEIKFPQIINGAQTVNAIYSAYKEKENRLSRRNSSDSDEEVKKIFSEIKLLFRVIADDSKDGKKTSVFEEKVIKYNNSQSSIKETDFYANNGEQIKLQEFFAEFGYFYEIKRGDRKYLDENTKEEHNLLKKKKSDFKYWDEKITMEKLASLWMAYYVCNVLDKDNISPTLDKTKKGSIFGYSGDKYYDFIFEKEDKLSDEIVKEMILAYNLFETIEEQTEVFGNKIKTGQIIAKLPQINKDNDKSTFILKENLFDNVKKIINDSFIFNTTLKKQFDNKNIFFENKEAVTQKIREYQFFSMGKYLTLAIFKLILDKCEYTDEIIKANLFKDKAFIKEKIIKKWLPIILDDLIKVEYDKIKNDISNPKIFYQRNEVFGNIKKRFKRLHIDKDKEFKELFPLNFD